MTQGGGKDRCTGRNKDGGPCGADRLPGRDRCLFHDPERRERVRAGRVAGGRGTSNRSRVLKHLVADALGPSEVQGLLSVALEGVLSGKLSPGIANAAANVGRSLIATWEAAEVEQRLAELEAAVNRGRAS